MKTIEVPRLTVVQVRVKNPKQRFHWDRDEQHIGVKTDIEFKSNILTATNFTQSTAILTLVEE